MKCKKGYKPKKGRCVKSNSKSYGSKKNSYNPFKDWISYALGSIGLLIAGAFILLAGADARFGGSGVDSSILISLLIAIPVISFLLPLGFRLLFKGIKKTYRSKNYNPLKMWGSWAGLVLGGIIISIRSNPQNGQLYFNILNDTLIGGLIVGFIIGWGINSLIRRIRK